MKNVLKNNRNPAFRRRQSVRKSEFDTLAKMVTPNRQKVKIYVRFEKNIIDMSGKYDRLYKVECFCVHSIKARHKN